MRTYDLEKLAKLLDLPYQGNPAVVVSGISSLKNASSGQVSFYNNNKYKDELNSAHGVVILQEKNRELCNTHMIFSDKPYSTFIKVMDLFTVEKKQVGIHPTAIIADDCFIGSGVSIGPFTVIEKGARIAANSTIGSQCHIGHNVSMDKNCLLYNNVDVADDVIIGKNAIIHSGAIIGADGFGFIQEAGESVKIPQLGSVELGNDIEIGSNTCIDRGTLDNTCIGNGVKIDNLTQVAHNVVIGDHTIIAGMVAIGGSTSIGACCMIGGGVIISDNIRVTDRVNLTGGTAVAYSILEPGVYSSGLHALPHKQWLRIYILLQKSELWIKSFMIKLRR